MSLLIVDVICLGTDNELEFDVPDTRIMLRRRETRGWQRAPSAFEDSLSIRLPRFFRRRTQGYNQAPPACCWIRDHKNTGHLGTKR